MTTRLVDTRWSQELDEAIQADSNELQIISPFVKVGALARLLAASPKSVSVITRFNLADFANGVSDIAALRRLLEHGATVRGIKNLHAKMYLFGSKRAIVTSANLTWAALNRNHEFGLISEDEDIIDACRRYFDDLWLRGGADLTVPQLDQWNDIVTHHQAEGGRTSRPSGLSDFGTDAAASDAPPPFLPVAVVDAPQAFVKFLGEGSNRVPLTFNTIEEIERAGCHWAVAYPATKRPRSVDDGAIVFIARLTRDPNDIRIFGRGVALKHQPGRDDATPADIALRPWKEKWPRYIRVHHAEFVAGSMANGVSLNELMDKLGAYSFAPTKRNALRGGGNADPRRAYQQQAAVELSAEGFQWLGERLQTAFDRYGKVPQYDIERLDWPDLPTFT